MGLDRGRSGTIDCREVINELIIAARPFTDCDVVDETSGTIPLMERMKYAIADAEEFLGNDNESGPAAKE